MVGKGHDLLGWFGIWMMCSSIDSKICTNCLGSMGFARQDLMLFAASYELRFFMTPRVHRVHGTICVRSNWEKKALSCGKANHCRAMQIPNPQASTHAPRCANWWLSSIAPVRTPSWRRCGWRCCTNPVLSSQDASGMSFFRNHGDGKIVKRAIYLSLVCSTALGHSNHAFLTNARFY